MQLFELCMLLYVCMMMHRWSGYILVNFLFFEFMCFVVVLMSGFIVA